MILSDVVILQKGSKYIKVTSLIVPNGDKTPTWNQPTWLPLLWTSCFLSISFAHCLMLSSMERFSVANGFCYGVLKTQGFLPVCPLSKYFWSHWSITTRFLTGGSQKSIKLCGNVALGRTYVIMISQFHGIPLSDCFPPWNKVLDAFSSRLLQVFSCLEAFS